MKLRVKLAALATASILLAACSSGGGSEDDASAFRVVFVAGATGPTASTATDMTYGIRAAMEEINSNGGVDGRQVELEVLDSGGDPTQAVSKLQEYLASNEKPDLLIPGVSSPEALALAPVSTRQKIVSCNNATNIALADTETYPYHFGIGLPSNRQLSGLAEGVQELGAEKVVAILANDAYGKDQAPNFEEKLDEVGIETEIEFFDPADLDLSVTFQRALDKDPDALFLETNGEQGRRLVETRASLGAGDIPTIAGFALTSVDGGPTNYASPAELENLYISVWGAEVFVAPEDRSEVQNTFLEGIAEQTSDEVALSAAFVGFDCLTLYGWAAGEADSFDADEVKTVLENPDTEYPPLMLFQSFHYTDDDHFPDPAPGDLRTVPASVEHRDGMYELADE